MKAMRILLLGIGVGLGLAGGARLSDLLPAADAKVTDKKLDKRVGKLLKRARKRGTVEGGVVAGVVTDLRDPDGRHRVRVRFPWHEPDEGVWAGRAIPPGTDPSSFLPEVDDEVLVAFVHGDIRTPVVVGELWGGGDAPQTGGR